MDDESLLAIHLARQAAFPAVFITQSLGAFNDNLFKQSLILAILFKLSLGDGDRSIWVNLCALLFILPFSCSRHWAGSSVKSSPRTR